MSIKQTFAEKAADYIRRKMMTRGIVEVYAPDARTLKIEATGDHRHTHGALMEFVWWFAATGGYVVETSKNAEPTDCDWGTTHYTFSFRKKKVYQHYVFDLATMEYRHEKDVVDRFRTPPYPPENEILGKVFHAVNQATGRNELDIWTSGPVNARKMFRDYLVNAACPFGDPDEYYRAFE